MAAATGPGAPFALGLSLVGRKLTGNALEIAWLVVLKLAVQPIITFVLVAYHLKWIRCGQVRQSF